MCLDYVQETAEIDKKNWQKGYKVFAYRSSDTLTTLYRPHANRPVFYNGSEYAANETLCTCEESDVVYLTGFHLFSTLQDAKRYQNILTDFSEDSVNYPYPTVIREVLYWGKITYGEQLAMPVIVASHIKL